MKIEFLESGSADCPLIRIYGNEPEVCKQLQRTFEQLANGSIEEVSLTDLPGVEPLGGCCLMAQGRAGVTGETGRQECNRASPGGQYVDRKRDPAPAVATPSIQSTNFMGKIVR